LSDFAPSQLTQRLVLDQPFALESGERLPQIEIAYRTWGKLAPEADNAVIVCHALTGSADAEQWWSAVIGRRHAIDPANDFIVCSNVLGGCYGSTGPTSIAPDGRPWGARFPRVSIRDQVRAQMTLADSLGIRRIRLVIGGSMGGLQALEWAVLDPDRVQALATIAASGRHSAWCLAWSEAQRIALRADPRFRDGNYDPADPPAAGLAAARAIAMIGYRSPHSLERRFGRATGHEVFASRADVPEDFAVGGWLRHHGKALADRFDANSYLTLLDAMDTHDLGRGRGGYSDALASIRQPVLVVSVTSDALYVPSDQQSLARMLPSAELAQFESEHGHDGFLIDADRLEPLLFGFRVRYGIGVQSPRRRVLPDGRRTTSQLDNTQSGYSSPTIDFAGG
jgi:homoserine O-acetyltransferase